MTEDRGGRSARAGARWFAGGVLAAALVAFLPGVRELAPPARATAAVLVLTAWCWLTVALPLPVASLLPALLLPATGAASAREVAPNYFHDVVMLFLGGFILALALERHALHRRFAMAALRACGARPRFVVLGFMIATGGISMFVNNTSTTLLMLPVAIAVIEGCAAAEADLLAPPLLLGVAYAASIGGLATPIGTAPNAIFLTQFAERFPEAPEISFGAWFLGVAPFAWLLLLVTWWLLTRPFRRVAAAEIPGLSQMLAAQAREPLTPAQRRVIGVFALVSVLWLTRQGADLGGVQLPGWAQLLPAALQHGISDATVALLGVLLLFLLPGEPGGGAALLSWEDCAKVPWGILLLFGGGFALAEACQSSGLSLAVGDSLRGLVTGLPTVSAVLATALFVTFLTAVTSNVATINLLLPLLFGAAVAAELHPLLLALPAALAVSCDFMLPVGTPPNAIVFATGRLTVPQMARAGLLLNLCSALLLTAFVVLWIAPRWGVDLRTFPSWAR